MAEPPDHLDLGRHRDVERWVELGARRALLALLTAVAIAALLGVFGQRPSTAAVATDRVAFEVSAPSHVRGGLFFQARFTIDAGAALENVVLVLGPGWFENLNVNTIEPSPVAQASRDGLVALSFGPLAAGSRLVIYMQFQVNPTNVGRRSADVELFDGDVPVARVDHTLTVFP